MGIEQNFNKNLKKSVKDQMPSLPTNSKFIFQQLLKNSHHIEENLKDETMLEINVGDLKKVLSERKWCSRRKLGKSCASCHDGCYKYEEQGLPSTRHHQQKIFINDVHSPLQNWKIC